MDPAMELRRYFEILRKRVSIIVVIAALAVGGVVLQLASKPAQYRADVSVLVTPQSGGIDLSAEGLQSGYRDTVMNNIIYLMKSRTLMERTGERLGMNPGALDGGVSVTGIHGTNVLTVTAKDSDPERAALIANTLTQEFMDYYSQINRSEATSARKFIEDQLSREKESLSRAEAELLAFKTRTGAVGLPEQINRAVSRTLDMQASYDALQLEQQTSRARIDAIQSKMRSQRDPLAQLSLMTNPLFVKARDNLTGLEYELASLRQSYTDEHPRVQLTLRRIEEAKKQMRDEGAKVAAGTSLGVSPVRESMIRDIITNQIDAEVARAKTSGMSQIMVKLQATLNTLPANELQLARLDRDVKVHDDMYLRLSGLYEDALIKERKAGYSGQATVFVVDPATVPGSAESKRLPFSAAFAGLVGVVVGSAVALLLDSLDDRVRSANQAEGAYGIPVLASIPIMDPRSYRHLSGAPALATVSLPVILAVLLGVAAAMLSLYMVHLGSGTDHTAFFARLLEVFQPAR